MKLTTTETLFYTASNDVHHRHIDDMQHDEPNKTNVSNRACEVSGSYESNFAVPGWIVFPDHIFNTSHIQHIAKNETFLSFRVRDIFYDVSVKDVNETWTYLQNLFTKGVREDK